MHNTQNSVKAPSLQSQVPLPIARHRKKLIMHTKDVLKRFMQKPRANNVAITRISHRMPIKDLKRGEKG